MPGDADVIVEGAAPIGRLHAGDFFGELCALAIDGAATRTATIVAASECVVATMDAAHGRVPRADLLVIHRRHPPSILR